MAEKAGSLMDAIKAEMKETMPGLLNVTKDLPGLGTFLAEAGAELKRLGVQGQAELAGALFNGSAYVPYGPGQSSAIVAEKEFGVFGPEKEPAAHEQEHTHGMQR
jgi:hypothetical protein